MRERKILFLGAAVAGALVLASILWLCGSGRSRISPEYFQKIEEGMTQAQVEALLGGPPRWEVEAKRGRDEAIYHFTPRPAAEWWGSEGVIKVRYDGGAVAWKEFAELPFEPKEPSFWESMFPWTKKVRTYGGRGQGQR